MSSSLLFSDSLHRLSMPTNYITIQNYEEAVSILKSVRKYMKFHVFGVLIDFLNQNDKCLRESTEEIKKLQTEIKTLQNQIQNAAKATAINESHNYPKDYLTKISSLKETKGFDSVYQLFEELSSNGNQEMISKAGKEGLWSLD
ncbi:hypothetical protein TVAG_124220 [Trichomonas vaginalis G3]|uniref:Uncharacterized protein n=1 Tax=Trichomonas vaginalis (strain ATCC PRA-98 / G3) TaxID=412133 RepID=A2EN12_TRIV3|nr:protein ubiquitination [Trichomonas vaginalis G3]EAY05997.1 hypothetical protein TVAG_124220 [Trichomonas vaginalis G3]KAI5512036.1 protein ubiquitination [Trichomonas vaginalis G3]|eukprot:XP_001318220.1 hypothetical protein [Trichomonas vaginalis G3]